MAGRLSVAFLGRIGHETSLSGSWRPYPWFAERKTNDKPRATNYEQPMELPQL